MFTCSYKDWMAELQRQSQNSLKVFLPPTFPGLRKKSLRCKVAHPEVRPARKEDVTKGVAKQSRPKGPRYVDEPFLSLRRSFSATLDGLLFFLTSRIAFFLGTFGMALRALGLLSASDLDVLLFRAAGDLLSWTFPAPSLSSSTSALSPGSISLLLLLRLEGCVSFIFGLHFTSLTRSSRGLLTLKWK